MRAGQSKEPRQDSTSTSQKLVNQVSWLACNDTLPNPHHLTRSGFPKQLFKQATKRGTNKAQKLPQTTESADKERETQTTSWIWMPVPARERHNRPSCQGKPERDATGLPGFQVDQWKVKQGAGFQQPLLHLPLVQAQRCCPSPAASVPSPAASVPSPAPARPRDKGPLCDSQEVWPQTRPGAPTPSPNVSSKRALQSGATDAGGGSAGGGSGSGSTEVVRVEKAIRESGSQGSGETARPRMG